MTGSAMVCCRQAKSRYPSQYWHWSLSLYYVTKPHWFDLVLFKLTILYFLPKHIWLIVNVLVNLSKFLYSHRSAGNRRIIILFPTIFSWHHLRTKLYVSEICIRLHVLPGFPTWWRHQMEPFSALIVLCAVNSPVNSPHKGQWRGAWMFS